MTPLNIVTSLELSKRLKELGVEVPSVFWWGKDKEIVFNPLLPNQHVLYHAYTSEELGRMLPRNCPEHELKSLQICHSFGDGWFVGYGDHMNLDGCHVEDGDSLGDTMAKMLIWLLDRGLITKEQVNETNSRL